MMKNRGGWAMTLSVGLTCAGVLCSCAGKERAGERGEMSVEPSAEMLAAWMTGSFSSRAQSRADPSYFDISLHMARIWPERADGPWLYVEQARSDTADKPYRQRVYRVRAGVRAGEFTSEVLTLPEPVSRFTGAWADCDRAAFRELGPGDLRQLTGCTVVLKWDAERRAFVGGTEGTGCASTREGASYTTSQIVLTEGLLTSWDRGFNSAGEQVWGAKEGGYRFVRE